MRQAGGRGGTPARAKAGSRTLADRVTKVLFNLALVASLIACAALLLAWSSGPWGYTNPSPRRVIFGGAAWYLASRGASLRVVRQSVSGTVRADEIPFAGPIGVWDL